MWRAPNKSRQVTSFGGASKQINHKSHARKKPAVKSYFFQFSGINITHIYSVQTVFFFYLIHRLIKHFLYLYSQLQTNCVKNFIKQVVV